MESEPERLMGPSPKVLAEIQRNEVDPDAGCSFWKEQTDVNPSRDEASIDMPNAEVRVKTEEQQNEFILLPIKEEEVDEDSSTDTKMDFEYSENYIKMEPEPERLMGPSPKALAEIQRSKVDPEAGCSFWDKQTDVNHSRDELAEETNNPETGEYFVESEDYRTLIPCSNKIKLNNTSTTDDEVNVCGFDQENYVSIPVVVLDKETETSTMKQVDNEMFIATHSEQSEAQDSINDRMIIENCVCNSCDFETSSLKIIKSHMMKEHSDKKPFHCKFCDYKCSQSSHLKTHERTHTGPKPFNCKICDYKSYQRTNLKRHERTHTGVKPFSCKYCDYKCSCRSHLKRHERTHTGVKPFHCKLCDFKCSTSSNLKIHERTHTGVKPFHCKLCDFKCSTSSNLKIHERTHTGEKPFNCKFCDYKCSQHSRLKTHERTHSGGKPFHCKFCDFKFSQSSHLKGHERTHTGVKPFNCKFCDYKCSHSSQLKRHERTHF